MDVILSQLTREQLQTHSAEALHAELQQLERIFTSAVQTLQRISSVRDTAAKFRVECDDSETLTRVRRIHALRDDAAMRLELLATEIHTRRSDTERKATASPSVQPKTPPVVVIDCLSPSSSPLLRPVVAPPLAPPARQEPPPVSTAAVAAAAAQQNILHLLMLSSAPPPPPERPPRHEIEINGSGEDEEHDDSGSDTESEDDDIPLHALIERQQSSVETTRSTCSSTALLSHASVPVTCAAAVKAEDDKRIPGSALPEQGDSCSRSAPLPGSETTAAPTTHHQATPPTIALQTQKKKKSKKRKKNQIKVAVKKAKA